LKQRAGRARFRGRHAPERGLCGGLPRGKRIGPWTSPKPTWAQALRCWAACRQSDEGGTLAALPDAGDQICAQAEQQPRHRAGGAHQGQGALPGDFFLQMFRQLRDSLQE